MLTNSAQACPSSGCDYSLMRPWGFQEMLTCRCVMLLHVQATLSLSRLGHERPEYLWLVLRRPSGDDRSPASSEPVGELRVRLQWTSAPISTADTAGQSTGCVLRLMPPIIVLGQNIFAV